MFKYTIMIAVVVSASLANSVPTNSSAAAANRYDPMSGAATILHKSKQYVKPDQRQSLFSYESSNGQSNHGGHHLLESGLSGLLEAISIPKKIIGSVVSLLKTIDLRKLVKIALIGGAVVVLGAVAVAGAAGIAAIVTAVGAAIPYIRFFFGHNKGQVSDSEIDVISEFVLDAFNKYDHQHKA
ncbi:uncharacterized protein LOC114129480 [Aphis gossypii]|uniref:Uncharacterized protein n=1 Tax=Aphis gossypii TaxID=80765 RepID=A0A9P0IYV3_APHGO|nr:uncharacterized protein LOC114129480 [Aphis gossypii]CAH1724187.1 unnamed protein product [Aphis gossypii]